MAQLTVLDKINIAKLSQTLATIDILKSGLYAGCIDLELPRKLYCIRKTIENTYNLNNSDSTLLATSNYLIALCGKYYLAAQSAISGGGSISPIIPTLPFTYLIPITGADFADATNYNNNKIVGKQLAIEWSGVNDYMDSTMFVQTATGFQMIVAGFDATTTNITDKFKIFIVNP